MSDKKQATSDKTSDSLKPCPFCGGEARISADPETVRDSQGRKWAYTVVCDRCAASSGLTFKPERAAAAWNTRKPVDVVLDRLENAAFGTPQTYDEDGFGNDDSEKVILLDRALEIVKENLT